jgi:tRNA (guanosine-2'-O-)-methyltransferase
MANIGSVIRNVDALGVGKLYVVSRKFPQAMFPKPGRGQTFDSILQHTSVGACKWVYVRVFDTTQACLQHLAKKRFVSVATSPHAPAHIPQLNLRSDFTRFAKLAMWFGNEAKGLTQEALTAARAVLSMPMCGMVESLNLAVCSGIVLQVVAQQRREFRCPMAWSRA